MKNFSFDYKGKKYWYSRSVVVGMFVFAKNKNGEWCVLANKRGNGCPSAIGMWNCPGGFLDFGETVYDAAARECFEETGVNINHYSAPAKFWAFNSTPKGSQNVSFKFYSKIEFPFAEDIQTSTEHSEPNEVAEIKWIPISQIKKYNWAFGHYAYIQQVYNNYINPNFVTRIKNYIISKFNNYGLY